MGRSLIGGSLALGISLGMSLGALMSPTSASAQQNGATPPLPSYLMVVGKATDRTKIGGYAASLPPIYASFDAYYLAIGGAGRGVTWLEGPWRDRSLIFAKFPSRAQIDAFWWGDAYRQAIRKRDNAGVFSVLALEGLVPTPFEGVGTGLLIVMTAKRGDTPAQSALSRQARASFSRGVIASGGILLADSESGGFTPMEGDTVFDQVTIAAWPTLSGRDNYLASRPATQAARLRAKLGLSAVASANGVARTQAPPAATPPRAESGAIQQVK